MVRWYGSYGGGERSVARFFCLAFFFVESGSAIYSHAYSLDLRLNSGKYVSYTVSYWLVRDETDELRLNFGRVNRRPSGPPVHSLVYSRSAYFKETFSFTEMEPILPRLEHKNYV